MSMGSLFKLDQNLKLPKQQSASKKDKARTSNDSVIEITNSVDDDIIEEAYEEDFDYDVPDVSHGDLFCKACNSHMNSDGMWQTHIQGKRHLKNIKKENISDKDRTYDVTNEEPAFLSDIKNVKEGIIGLQHCCEFQRIDEEPIYQCFLCSANLPNAKQMIDHVTGTKHRLACLKEKETKQYELISKFCLRKCDIETMLDEFVEKSLKENGQGKMQVRVERLRPPGKDSEIGQIMEISGNKQKGTEENPSTSTGSSLADINISTDPTQKKKKLTGCQRRRIARERKMANGTWIKIPKGVTKRQMKRRGWEQAIFGLDWGSTNTNKRALLNSKTQFSNKNLIKQDANKRIKNSMRDEPFRKSNPSRDQYDEDLHYKDSQLHRFSLPVRSRNRSQTPTYRSRSRRSRSSSHRSHTPSRRRSRTPSYRRSRSPSYRRSHTPLRRRSRTPPRRRSYTPIRRRSPTPPPIHRTHLFLQSINPLAQSYSKESRSWPPTNDNNPLQDNDLREILNQRKFQKDKPSNPLLVEHLESIMDSLPNLVFLELVLNKLKALNPTLEEEIHLLQNIGNEAISKVMGTKMKKLPPNLVDKFQESVSFTQVPVREPPYIPSSLNKLIDDSKASSLPQYPTQNYSMSHLSNVSVDIPKRSSNGTHSYDPYRPTSPLSPPFRHNTNQSSMESKTASISESEYFRGNTMHTKSGLLMPPSQRPFCDNTSLTKQGLLLPPSQDGPFLDDASSTKRGLLMPPSQRGPFPDNTSFTRPALLTPPSQRRSLHDNTSSIRSELLTPQSFYTHPRHCSVHSPQSARGYSSNNQY